MCDASSKALDALKRLSQSIEPLKQEATNIERVWTPRPISPPRKNTHFSTDLSKDLENRRIRSRILVNRHDNITKILSAGTLSIETDITRSPSPPPVYDPDTGQRLNTRELRFRENLEQQRRECIGEATRINSEIKIPSGFRPPLKEVKLYIPQKDHPNYNFVGLIIGPRGLTQKRLESETGAKVTIRGKGAAKEGGQLRQDIQSRFPIGWNDETHVHIAGESWDKVDAAIELVEPLLTYVEEEENIHKRLQMLQLAKINGTIRLDMLGNDTAGQLMMIQQTSGPMGPSRTGLYNLPDQINRRVEELYRRDVACVKKLKVENTERKFREFVSQLEG
jgi:hypothetical protein